MRCVPLFTVAEGTSGVVFIYCPGGHGEGLRRTHGEAAGTQSGSYFDERNMVNVGTTLPWFPEGRRPAEIPG
jgi:hypothetical protein